MSKAILSKRDIYGLDPICVEYISYVSDLLENRQVLRLVNHYQHCNTSRLQHSLNVSYYSFIICKALGWDKVAAARAGLLHDLYYYDWRVKSRLRGSHPSWHPRVAKDNARKICSLSPIEEDAILNHMWPLTLTPPRYKESYIVSLTDKLCATLEFVFGYGSKVKGRIFSKVYPSQ